MLALIKMLLRNPLIICVLISTNGYSQSNDSSRQEYYNRIGIHDIIDTIIFKNEKHFVLRFKQQRRQDLIIPNARLLINGKYLMYHDDSINTPALSFKINDGKICDTLFFFGRGKSYYSRTEIYYDCDKISRKIEKYDNGNSRVKNFKDGMLINPEEHYWNNDMIKREIYYTDTLRGRYASSFSIYLVNEYSMNGKLIFVYDCINKIKKHIDAAGNVVKSEPIKSCYFDPDK